MLTLYHLEKTEYCAYSKALASLYIGPLHLAACGCCLTNCAPFTHPAVMMVAFILI